LSIIINFVRADVSREEYFSRPLRSKPLYLIDFKLSGKIVRFPYGLLKTISFYSPPLKIKDFRRFVFLQILRMYVRTPGKGHLSRVFSYFECEDQATHPSFWPINDRIIFSF